jgi:hypothetical protein
MAKHSCGNVWKELSLNLLLCPLTYSQQANLNTTTKHMHVCRIHLFLLAKFHQEMKLLFEKKKRF